LAHALRHGLEPSRGVRQIFRYNFGSLGFRVPFTLVLFDHTSVLRFLETRFGAEVPNLSAWRRSTVGDLTSVLNLKKVDTSIPNFPSTIPAVQQVIQECVANLAGTTRYTVPTTQTMPTQESGSPTRPSGTC
jgi:phospholipase C